MKVIGLYADEALERFPPGQHVNVWEVMPPGFYSEAVMNDLPDVVLESPEDFFLEPTDEDGTPVDPNSVTGVGGPDTATPHLQRALAGGGADEAGG